MKENWYNSDNSGSNSTSIGILHQAMPISLDTDTISHANCTSIIELTLYQLIAHEYGLYEFSTHCAKEFSCENVLALIEFYQFEKFFHGMFFDQFSK